MYKSFDIAIRHSCHLIMATMLIAVFSSCVKENTPSLTGAGENIRFEICNDNWNKLKSKSSVRSLHGTSIKDTLFLHISSAGAIEAGTKANPVTTETFYNSIGISAYKYQGEWSEDLTPDYIYNEQLLQENDWTSSHRWPGSSYNIRFFAYAPFGCIGLSLSAEDYSGTPLLTYEVPDLAEDQTDLIVAATGEISGKSKPSAELDFSHILTGLRIVSGDDIIPGRITSISLNGIYGKGTYSYATNTWEPSHTKVFRQSVDIAVDGTADQPFMDDSFTFMMIPQTLPEGATLSIDFIDELTSTTHSLTASIAGIVWPIGQIVTFRIETSSISIEPVLEVEIPEFTYEGGSATYTVSSYTTITSGSNTTTVATPWTAEFVEEDGNGGYRTTEKPEWISDITQNGDGGTQSCSITVCAQEHLTERPHNDILKGTSPVSGIYDLATDGGTKPATTANCYIVNAPGTYSFPLVYGNAIKNGAANTSSYIHPYPDDITSSALEVGLNHLGEEISSPYIYENQNCEPYIAELLWQDEKNLVSNIRLSENKQAILFDVRTESISQGNAVIVLRDKDGTAMWNWHIWVTDYILGENEVSFLNGSKRVQISPYEIGYCDTYQQVAPERSAYIKIAVNNLERICRITQKQDVKTIFGNSVLFTWGRKDPITGWSGQNEVSNVNDMYKTRYNKDGDAITGPFETDSTWPYHDKHLVLSIQNPDILSRNGSQYTLYNLWNNGSVGTTIESGEFYPHVKTIYDPSPKGYRVTRVTEFNALKQYPYSQSEKDRITEIQVEDGGTIIFRMVNRGLYEELEDTNYCTYWTSLGTNNNAYLCSMQRSIGTSNASRNYMFPIRPVKEQ